MFILKNTNGAAGQYPLTFCLYTAPFLSFSHLKDSDHQININITQVTMIT